MRRSKAPGLSYVRLAAAIAGILLLATWGRWLWTDPDPVSNFGKLPDFQEIDDVSVMKAAFIDYLRPMVEFQNAQISEQRQKLLQLGNAVTAGQNLGRSKISWLQDLAQSYGLELDCAAPHSGQCIELLLPRVDIIPVELAVVQAAKESGWGRSRFAREANNLFGQWCYQPGCGIVPNHRTSDARHEVQKFDSVYAAISSYMRNLNSHSRYESLRQLRAELRAQNQPVTGLALASGLVGYSERREAYVEEVKSMILQYRVFEPARQKS